MCVHKVEAVSNWSASISTWWR